MKSNRERSKIILQRYNNPTAEQEQTKKQPTKQQRRLFVANKKSIIAICMACVMVVTLGLGLGLGLGLKDSFDLDNMFIANFEQYTAIGSGALGGVELATGNTVSMQSTDSAGALKLVGVKEDGKVEEVKVVKDKGDEPKKIKWYLSNMVSLKNFTLVEYRSKPTYDTGIPSFGYYNGLQTTFVIDNRTGKIYSLKKLAKHKDTFYQFCFSTQYYGGFDDVQKYESEDSFVFCNKYDIVDTHYDMDFPYEDYYRATIENGDLKLTKLFSVNRRTDIMDDMVKFSNIYVDKYCNIFLINNIIAPNLYSSSNYVYTAKGKFVRLEDGINRIVKCQNGLMYSADGTKVFNADGEMEDASFEHYDFYCQTQYLVKKTENEEYYYKSGKITKLTWKNDVEFDLEETQLEEYESDERNYVVTADKIYFRRETKIYSIDVVTKEKQEISEENLYFTSIKTDNLGNVSFIARDGDFQVVTGIIRNDGTVEKNVRASEYEVYYIKPLN